MQVPSAVFAPRRAVRARSGSTLSGFLASVLALVLFAGPFLLDQEGPSWIGSDLRRVETDVPFAEDVALVEEELDLELATLLAEASDEWFGEDSAALRESGIVDLDRLESGRRVYEQNCSGCHGDSGDGAGPAARFLWPRPRIFRRGVFKFTSTESGGKPLRGDLYQVVTNGLAGASMPGFPLLPEEFRWDVVEYVRYLSMRGEFEHSMLDSAYDEEEEPDAEEWAEIIYERWDPDALRAVYPNVPETARDADSVERGRELFLDTELTACSACHGDTGRGDGPTSDSYEDDWGYGIRPRDFTAGVFRAGNRPEDLWRSIATGINGTPMGSFQGNLTGEQIWDVVHYVQHLASDGGEEQ